MIIVVDASPDNTYNIALSYADKDNRIKVINNKENVGAGMARRIGIKTINPNTEYTTFLYSDDYYKPDVLEVLYKIVGHPGALLGKERQRCLPQGYQRDAATILPTN